MTKKYKTKYIICKIISILLTLAPILVYVVIGFYNNSISKRVALGLCLILSIIFVGFNIIIKHRIRSTIWILMLGVYIAVNNIIPLLILVAVGTLLDEFVFEKLCKKYKEQWTINKEIDKRETKKDG